jgi:hypothetical protein
MKLTTEQIDQLYLFTRQHYVEWYDLQSELVDHLANAIETQLQENPKLTFDEVLNKEFQKFGVYGFMGVVEEKQKFLGNKYRKLIWEFYKEFFRLPKIILTIALIYVVYTYIKFFGSPEDVFPFTFLFMLVVTLVLSLKSRKELKLRQNRTGKKWLFEENSMFAPAASPIIAPLCLDIPKYVSKIIFFQNGYSITASIILVLIAIFLYLHLKIIPQKVSEELAKTYPEYSIT